MSKAKLYAYVDETYFGLPREAFIVSTVIIGKDRDEAIAVCEAIEQQTRKMRRKWRDSEPERRIPYIQRVLKEPLLHGNMYIAVYEMQTGEANYVPLTLHTVTWAISSHKLPHYKANILVDGFLSRQQDREFGVSLRRMGIQTEKVKGVREESNALGRLADALCGFTREVREGHQYLTRLFNEAKTAGAIIEK